jgi:hypothetical protein
MRRQLMYPKYDYKALLSGRLSYKANILLFILVLMSRFMPLYASISLGIFIVALVIKHIINKKMSKLNKLNEMMVTLLSIFICYDILDYNISWSITIVVPMMIIILSSIFTALIVLRARGWELYYHNHMYTVVSMLLVIVLCMTGLIQFNMLLLSAILMTGLSMFFIYLRIGKDYLYKLKHFSHL